MRSSTFYTICHWTNHTVICQVNPLKGKIPTHEFDGWPVIKLNYSPSKFENAVNISSLVLILLKCAKLEQTPELELRVYLLVNSPCNKCEKLVNNIFSSVLARNSVGRTESIQILSKSRIFYLRRVDSFLTAL